jgi:hypothetical protein
MTKVSAALGFAFRESRFWAGGIEEQASAEVGREEMVQKLVVVGARQRHLYSAHGIERATT